MAKITDISGYRYDYNAERLGNVLGNKIKEARKRLKWSQLRLKEELEENGLELTTQALGKWEKGESVPNAYQFLLLSRVLGIKNPLEYFVSSSPRPELNEEGEDKLRDYRKLLKLSGLYRPRFFREMPRCLNRVSAGTGVRLDDDSFEMADFDEDEIPEGADYSIIISGNSMEPRYHDGQVIWVKKCSSLKPGDIGVFVIDGEGYIKKYEERIPEDKESYTDSEGVLHKQIVLVPLNEDYDEIIAGENNALTIAGRVLN